MEMRWSKINFLNFNPNPHILIHILCTLHTRTGTIKLWYSTLNLVYTECHQTLLWAQVLRKEITFEELQQYGFCLFTALAHLHKQVMLLPYLHLFLILLILQWSIFFWTVVLQGIVHRDVKPGNFLFSRKQRLGYLVDFNLAMVCTVHHNSTLMKFSCIIAISRFPSIWKPESLQSNCKFLQRLV
jgi:serine/threonine protein kinase